MRPVWTCGSGEEKGKVVHVHVHLLLPACVCVCERQGSYEWSVKSDLKASQPAACCLLPAAWLLYVAESDRKPATTSVVTSGWRCRSRNSARAKRSAAQGLEESNQAATKGRRYEFNPSVLSAKKEAGGF